MQVLRLGGSVSQAIEIASADKLAAATEAARMRLLDFVFGLSPKGMEIFGWAGAGAGIHTKIPSSQSTRQLC